MHLFTLFCSQAQESCHAGAAGASSPGIRVSQHTACAGQARIVGLADRLLLVQARANLERVRNLVTQHTAKHDEDRTTTFLYAATRGDVALIRQVCSSGRL